MRDDDTSDPPHMVPAIGPPHRGVGAGPEGGGQGLLDPATAGERLIGAVAAAAKNAALISAVIGGLRADIARLEAQITGHIAWEHEQEGQRAAVLNQQVGGLTRELAATVAQLADRGADERARSAAWWRGTAGQMVAKSLELLGAGALAYVAFRWGSRA